MELSVLFSMAKIIAIFGAIPAALLILFRLGEILVFFLSSLKGIDLGNSLKIKPTFVLSWLLLGFFISVILCL